MRTGYSSPPHPSRPFSAPTTCASLSVRRRCTRTFPRVGLPPLAPDLCRRTHLSGRPRLCPPHASEQAPYRQLWSPIGLGAVARRFPATEWSLAARVVDCGLCEGGMGVAAAQRAQPIRGIGPDLRGDQVQGGQAPPEEPCLLEGGLVYVWSCTALTARQKLNLRPCWEPSGKNGSHAIVF